jgi:hypothetical protein
MDNPTILKFSHYLHTCLWRWNRQCSGTSAYKIQTSGNYPEENIQHTEHGESLKLKNVSLLTDVIILCNFGLLLSVFFSCKLFSDFMFAVYIFTLKSIETTYCRFYIFLTVRLNVILVSDQPDAQFLLWYFYLNPLQTSEVLRLDHSFIWCWNLEASSSRLETPGKFWNVVLEKDRKDQFDWSCEKLRCIA